MAWANNEIFGLASAYCAHWALATANPPVPRTVSDQHWWAVKQVQDAALDGSLPIDVLDALLRAPDGDDSYRAYVAAGPLEELLEDHPHRYTAAIADKCRVDPLWAKAIGGVWLTYDERYRELPKELQLLIPAPSQQLASARRKRKRRRSSKRQR